jgi:hypothetical protein
MTGGKVISGLLISVCNFSVCPLPCVNQSDFQRLHSSMPLRHTYTSPTNRTTIKSIISP